MKYTLIFSHFFQFFSFAFTHFGLVLCSSSLLHRVGS
ncbi:hypothetical protein ES319_A04G073800v1 [Gossypium barbadense]|uniref:Uncharacterized protein n=1 Tax=Gossypium barbadense TaxID=3634 RepID=A0A5J5W549_GOSBA|nr:hypothetical protein ES319_A04G073800v1 [Gossypium barbadense]